MLSNDLYSNLICSKESGFDTIFRITDNVRNLYESQDNSDRIYGAGSRLEQSGINLNEKKNSFQGGYGRLVTKGSQLFYDEEGNLVKKIEPDGGTWIYKYFGNGMLEKVIRPDRSSVRFKYDSLGRRIEKAVSRSGSEEVPETGTAEESVEESIWEKVGGVRLRKQNAKTEKSRVVIGSNESVYAEEGINANQIQKVIRFMWDGNTLLHEWEEDNTAHRLMPKARIDYKADFVVKLEKEEEEWRREEAERGQRTPDSLVTWIFQDDFVPRGKITKDGVYSIVSDYLGTPVEAYDGDGNKVWERELDIYGRVKTGRKDVYGRTEKEIGEKGFIPFRFQGQYEDEETGLYYNRFRYYSPEDGCYTQQDPIGLAGGNPTVYGYVGDSNVNFDPFGLDNRMPKWMKTRKGYQRHHIIPASVWDDYSILQKSGMNVNGATNMTFLPVAEGIDLANPNSSLHLGWNNVHKEYNQYIREQLDKISKLAKENDWEQRKIQKEIRKFCCGQAFL